MCWILTTNLNHENGVFFFQDPCLVFSCVCGSTRSVGKQAFLWHLVHARAWSCVPRVYLTGPGFSGVRSASFMTGSTCWDGRRAHDRGHDLERGGSPSSCCRTERRQCHRGMFWQTLRPNPTVAKGVRTPKPRRPNPNRKKARPCPKPRRGFPRVYRMLDLISPGAAKSRPHPSTSLQCCSYWFSVWESWCGLLGADSIWTLCICWLVRGSSTEIPLRTPWQDSLLPSSAKGTVFGYLRCCIRPLQRKN